MFAAFSSAVSTVKSLVQPEKPIPQEVQKHQKEYDAIFRTARESLSTREFDEDGLKQRVVALNQAIRETEASLKTSNRGSTQQRTGAQIAAIKIGLAKLDGRLQPLHNFISRAKPVHSDLSEARFVPQKAIRDVDYKMAAQHVEVIPPEVRMLDNEYEAIFLEVGQLLKQDNFDDKFTELKDKVRMLKSDMDLIERLPGTFPIGNMEETAAIVSAVVHMRTKVGTLENLLQQTKMTYDQIGPAEPEATAVLHHELDIQDYAPAAIPVRDPEDEEKERGRMLEHLNDLLYQEQDADDSENPPASSGFSLWSAVSGAASSAASLAGKAKRGVVKRVQNAAAGLSAAVSAAPSKPQQLHRPDAFDVDLNDRSLWNSAEEYQAFLREQAQQKHS